MPLSLITEMLGSTPIQVLTPFPLIVKVPRDVVASGIFDGQGQDHNVLFIAFVDGQAVEFRQDDNCVFSRIYWWAQPILPNYYDLFSSVRDKIRVWFQLLQVRY